MITKPEDANPHIVNEMHESEAELTAPFFTSSECAEIARAYAATVINPQYIHKNPQTNRELIETDKLQWEYKFKEWETK